MSKTNASIEEEAWAELNLDETALQSLLDKPFDQQDPWRLRDGEQHKGFDNNMGDTWIYPSNLPCRSYQMAIVQASLYNNTLVVLPTGLGKTFIAAVVMYNFFRWYPRGKVLFLAPTRPLVNQQIEACQKIMPFPKKDTIELTGRLPRNKRSEMWKTKRVFFATPQVVQSDIVGGRVTAGPDETEDSYLEAADTSFKTDFPFEQIKLIVIDEAHKAKGKYAYTEVIQFLRQKTKYFRVLALSATPGRTMEDVAEVCRNLLISHLEVRWDTSIDVLPYVHKRTMETVVVKVGEKIKAIREELLEIVDPYLRQLIEAEVLSGSLMNINRNYLLYEQKHFRERSLHLGRHPQHSAITSNFAICISLYHALELLERHGLRVFLNNFEGDVDGKDKFVLQMDRRLRDLVERLKAELGANPFDVSAAPMTNGKIAEIPKDLDFGHPKFEKARECLLKHFENNKESRAIVFCEYRESVMLTYRLLLQHTPLLRPRCFVGQGGNQGTLRALTQKQQIQIMNDFRTGKSNILIATSIGEEGIDVGEVELIVCFDISTSNPTRFVQRIGRTGRQKNGHVIMLVTEGREQQLLREVLANKDQTNKKLLKSSVVQQALYKHAPRLVPTEFKPKCLQIFVKPQSDDEDEESVKVKKPTGSSKKNKGNTKSGQDLRKFFNKKPKEIDKEDLEYFELDTNMTQAKPGLQTQQAIASRLQDKMKNIFKDLQSPIASQTQKPRARVSESPRKQLNSSQGSIKSYFKEMNNSQGSIKDYFKDQKEETQHKERMHHLRDVSDNITIDLCEEMQFTSEDKNHIHYLRDASDNITIDLSNNDNDNDIKIAKDSSDDEENLIKLMGPERVKELRAFLSTTWTTPEVLKRAEINDLGYHLKSKEMSDLMKKFLLKAKPEYIKENLEKMQILKALQDNDNANDEAVPEEEKSIREIHNIIVELFGGLRQVEDYLQEVELQEFKQKCLNEQTFSEEEDSQDMEEFRKKLDNIFEGLGDGKRHDNYDWVQERLKQTEAYKEFMRKQNEHEPQESMVYDTFVDPTEDNNLEDNFEDHTITDTKFCSQWKEFNKPDIAFKSTPLPRQINDSEKDRQDLKKTSLLSKLQEFEEEHEKSNQEDDEQLANALKMLDKKFKEHSLMEMQQHSTSQDSLDDLENYFKAKRKDYELRKAEQEGKILQEFESPNEDELLKAVNEAELQLTQHETNNKQETRACSLNETPDLDLNEDFKLKDDASTSPKPTTPPDLLLHKELDIDMEAFMEPFPEEQELIRTSLLTSRRESLKENLINAQIVRESPDLFNEEHMHSSPIQKPIVNKTLSKDFLNPATIFKSPQKPLFNSQNPDLLLKSPTTRLPIVNKKLEKSPSLFDMYLQNTKGKGKLPKAFANTSSTSSTAINVTNCDKPSTSQRLKNSPLIQDSQPNESLIVVRKRKSKRQIFDSDSEDKEEKNSTDTDSEKIPATQIPRQTSIRQRHRKRRRLNSFLEQEAAVSGSDQSEDENDLTVGHYMLDSIVVPSDDEDPDQASTSHMQAMYLQSLKSPQQRRGTFKIPAPRVFNDHSRIFSQAVLPGDTYSQYQDEEDDSFITQNIHQADVSMCPLERAEKILRERRKAKKLALLNQESKVKGKRRIHLINDSSEEEDTDFEFVS